MRRPVGTFMLHACVVGLLLAGACTSHHGLVPPVPATVVLETSTTAPDLTGVGLAAVAGRTTTTSIPLGPGGATLNGAITGPEGALGGATVHIERLVGDASGAADVVTQPDGTWAAPNVLGGRYRVRAWRAPDLALTTPQLFFLGGSETKTLALRLDRYTGMGVQGAIAPNPPIVGEPANIVVSVTTRSVDDKGVVRGIPVAGAVVELTGSGDWRTSTQNPDSTDNAGHASWQATCRSGGQQPLSVVVNNAQSFPLSIPDCGVPPPTTTAPPSTTSSLLGTTSTTHPPSTTTTTRRTTTTR
ncbi:MAG: hypothetical protein QOG64_783 [Acidimicrobiaceae bacterium]|nr:hypothetical protein [Acidimicrobiaceae bacterium]